MMKSLISILPVLIFTIFLIYLDSFKLVRKGWLVLCLAWGSIAAVLVYFLNSAFFEILQTDFDTYSKIYAPFVEELVKIIFLLFLFKFGKLGFIIDAAIYGFAIGAGFAVVENIHYIQVLDVSNPMVWVVRGLGTSIMHGGTMVLFSIVFMATNKGNSYRIILFVLGLSIAILLHAIYNRFILTPLLSSLVIVISIPLIVNFAFQVNEKTLKKWLFEEFDSELNFLIMIKQGVFKDTNSGRYIEKIKHNVSDMVVVDMMAYLRLYAELSILAKRNLMLQEQGFKTTNNEETKWKLEELKALESSIGKTGLIMLTPILKTNKRDIWKLNLLD